jgi:hypothetical protein
LPLPAALSGEAARPEAPRVSWCAHSDVRLLARRFDHDCERARPGGLAGAQWIEDVDALRERLDHAEPYADGAPWVLKPGLSAAGRGALRGRGATLLAGTAVEDSPAVAALFAAGPSRDPPRGAVLEPWVERLEDFGCRARIADGRVEIEGVHRLLVTASGGFRGVELLVGDGPLPGMASEEADALVAATTAVGIRLATLGYEGPFGVDAFAYRDAEGERRFRAQCEVNVRYTFGFVAAALAASIGGARGWAPGSLVALRFGKGASPVPVHDPARDVVSLLEPAPVTPGVPVDDDTSAWLERVSPPYFT